MREGRILMPLATAKCAMQQANGVETAAISLGQRYDTRVRHLEELLSTYQRERDEARDECLHLRDRLARTTSSNSVEATAGHSNSMATEDKPMQQQQQEQQQPHHSAGNLQRSSFSALGGRSLETMTPALRFERYANTTELSGLRQQQQQLHEPTQEHQQLHQGQQAQSQGQLHHQQLQECHSNSSVTSGALSPTWTQDSLHLQVPSPGDAHLPQGVPSSFNSCSNLSFSPTTPPVSANLHGGGGFRAELVPSSSLLHRQRPVHLPEPPEADMQVLLNSLPERGQLLQAVVQAGPLLQTLMLAGPLPQWRRPPPAVASVEIPKAAMPSSGGSSMDKARGTAAGSFSANPGDLEVVLMKSRV